MKYTIKRVTIDKSPGSVIDLPPGSIIAACRQIFVPETILGFLGHYADLSVDVAYEITYLEPCEVREVHKE